MIIRLCIWGLVFLFWSCTPKITQTIFLKIAPLNENECFGVIENGTLLDTIKKITIGHLIYRADENNFDYELAIDSLSISSKRLGGNVLCIDKHVLPQEFGSSYHYLNTSVYSVDNACVYERFIYWNRQRLLKIRDFKGAINLRPARAAALSSFNFSVVYNSKIDCFDLLIRSFFDTKSSYFKSGDNDSIVLEHEQLHFDITELYSRIFCDGIVKMKLDRYSYQKQIKDLYRQVIDNLIIKQDEYDNEVYNNLDLQTKWKSWVENELNRLDKYRDKKITVANTRS